MSDIDESDVREASPTAVGEVVGDDERTVAETAEAPLPLRRRPPGGPNKEPRAPKDAPKWVFGVLAVLLLALAVAFGRGYYRKNVLPDRLYQSASDHFESEQYEEAAREYEMAGSLGSAKTPLQSDEILFRKAFAYEKIGKLDEAASAYAEYCAANSADVSASGRLAKVYLALGRSFDALPYLEAAFEVLSGDPEIHLALGGIYDAKDDSAKAMENYVRFVESDVRDADSLLDVGRALMKSGRYRDALTAFEKAAGFVASGDMSAYHAVNAAKNMLGWPTDASLVIVPGVSIGSLRLGMSRAEALAAWGDTPYKVNEDGYSVWSYTGASGNLEGTVYFDAEGVIEIVAISTKHSTSDGLGFSNFREPKYADRFTRVRDEDSEPYIYRYTLNDGGLAFYTGVPSAPNRPRAVVYAGKRPLTEYLGARWMRY